MLSLVSSLSYAAHASFSDEFPFYTPQVSFSEKFPLRT